MLTETEKKWLEEREVGMCCRCVHYYTDITDCGVGCQWIANKEFPMLQCFRFKNEGYTIEKGDWADVAEFEARVAARLATMICDRFCADILNNKVCCRGHDDRSGMYVCRLKHARLAVEEEMECEK